VIAQISIPVADIAAASLSLVVFGIAIGSVALFASAATGLSKVAISAGVGVIAVGWMMATFLVVNESLAKFQKLSAFYYYSSFDHRPLIDGVSWGNLSVLAAATAVLLGASVWAFDRRDLRG
jgi:ABC-type transport system involved in multi-copper enzyme maturation permease subunit